jgi:hypothetical protein
MNSPRQLKQRRGIKKSAGLRKPAHNMASSAAC